MLPPAHGGVAADEAVAGIELEEGGQVGWGESPALAEISAMGNSTQALQKIFTKDCSSMVSQIADYLKLPEEHLLTQPLFPDLIPIIQL